MILEIDRRLSKISGRISELETDQLTHFLFLHFASLEQFPRF